MTRSAKPSVHVVTQQEKPVEKRLNYLFNINKIIKINTGALKSKFIKWREMNIYKVSQELKKEFEMVKKMDQHSQSLQRFQKELSGDLENSEKTSQLDLNALFENFDNLVEKDKRRIFAKKIKPEKNEILEEEEEESEEDENARRVKQVMSRKGSLGELRQRTIHEEDERDSVELAQAKEKDQRNLEDFIAQEKEKNRRDMKNSQDSFNVNNSLTEPNFASKEAKPKGNSLIHKIYASQMEKNQIKLSFGPSPNFALQNKTMSFINDSKNSGNQTKSRIFDSKKGVNEDTYDSTGSNAIQKKQFDTNNSQVGTDDSKNFMVLNSLNENDTLGAKSGDFSISDMSRKMNVKSEDSKKEQFQVGGRRESLENGKFRKSGFVEPPNLDIVIDAQKDFVNQMKEPQNSFGSDIMFTHKKSKYKQNKRILELHYNLLFALTNHAKKLMKEGYNALQEEILIHYSKKTFETLIYFIESKMDFKKIVNLICLINFTNHGFYKNEYDEIILKIVQNFHIKCVYVLLKMDSFGFFTIKNDIFGFSDSNFKNKKKSLLGGKGTILDRVPLSGQSSGVRFNPISRATGRDDRKIMDFNNKQTKKSVVPN